MPLPIFALALTAFALGTAELVPNGLRQAIGHDLGVSVAQAGWITTSFALGAMLGGPIVAAATLRLPRKPLLLALTVVFMVANIATALSNSLWAVSISRGIAGAMLGGFLGTAITVATTLVADRRRAGAIAVVFTGFTISNVIGVPIGNLIGRAAAWQDAFWVVSFFALLGLLVMWAVLPRNDANRDGQDDHSLKVLVNGPLWSSFLSIALGYGGLFVAYTYIAPFLTEVTGLADGSVT